MKRTHAPDASFDMTLPHRSVYEALAAVAAADPSRLALVYGNVRFTYGELIERIDAVARHLHAMGIGQGDAFALFAQNRPEHLWCYYAAARIGAMFVPINPNMTLVEVGYASSHSGSKVLFYDETAAEAVEAADLATPIARLRRLGEALPGPSAPAPSVAGPEDDLLVIYTSGTTGSPKGIVLGHRGQMLVPRSLGAMWALTRSDVTLVALPLGYLYGLSTAAAVALQTGGTVVLLRRFHPRDVLEALVDHHATVYHGVPTMFSMMLDYCEQQDLFYDLSHVRVMICAGAPLPEEVRRRFAGRFGKQLQNYYAMTECTPVFGPYDGDIVPEGSVGRLAPGAGYRIVRPDGEDCADGEEGEILARAPGMIKRHLNAPKLLSTTLRDGFVQTGDLGRRDADGFFYITGRLKDLIIRGGANISPSEVEEVLQSHPAVQQAAVVGAPDSIFGEVPVAYVVRRHAATVSDQDLIGWSEKSLADFKVPRRYVFVDELPLGKTGKVDKTRLKENLAEDEKP